MKRFVTYLYECERGNKTKNVGFIRVNVRGQEAKMELYLRNILRNLDAGKIFALVYKDELHGIWLGDISIENGQCDSHIAFQTEGMMESAFSLNDIEGIGIRFESGAYIASCWKDDFADEITRGEFSVEPEAQGVETQVAEVQGEEEMAISEQMLEVMPEKLTEMEATRDRKISCEKIDLSQIRDLPSPNWHLATNSFLVHGFWNYGYLVLKKELEEGKETLSLGVPGIFEKPEAVMAVFFGFPSFETIPKEMVSVAMNQPMYVSEKEKNQDAKTGSFGCWFVNLKG